MVLSRDVSNNGGWLEKIYTTQKQTDEEIRQQILNRDKLLRLFRDSNRFLTVISRIKDRSTEFEPMNSYEVNGEIDVIYKNWEIQLVSVNEEAIDTLATILIPYIDYKIVYENGNENDIDFYDSEYNLKQTSHFEIRNDAFYLKLSVYMKKYFDSNALIVPNAKVIIDFRNPLQFLR